MSAPTETVIVPVFALANAGVPLSLDGLSDAAMVKRQRRRSREPAVATP